MQMCIDTCRCQLCKASLQVEVQTTVVGGSFRSGKTHCQVCSCMQRVAILDLKFLVESISVTQIELFTNFAEANHHGCLEDASFKL